MEGKLDPNTNPLEVELNEHGKPKYKGQRPRSHLPRSRVSNEKFTPHVIEPSAGADRATLAFLCEAYTEDEQPDEKGKMQTRVVMKFHPRIAPIKAAVFPLVKKGWHARDCQRHLSRAEKANSPPFTTKAEPLAAATAAKTKWAPPTASPSTAKPSTIRRSPSAIGIRLSNGG